MKRLVVFHTVIYRFLSFICFHISEVRLKIPYLMIFLAGGYKLKAHQLIFYTSLLVLLIVVGEVDLIPLKVVELLTCLNSCVKNSISELSSVSSEIVFIWWQCHIFRFILPPGCKKNDCSALQNSICSLTEQEHRTAIKPRFIRREWFWFVHGRGRYKPLL